MTIGVIDSGIGGIKVLELLVKNFHGNDFVYVFDKSGLPYGNKSVKQIRNRITIVCNFLVYEKKVDALVIACNTASCVALEQCKKKYNIPVYGLIPPLKQLSSTKYKSILLLSTFATSKILVKNKNLPDNVILSPQKNLAKYLENYSTNIAMIDEYIKKNLKQYKEKCDCIFLGCTHYYFIKERLKILFNVDVIDGRADLILEMQKTVNKLNKNSHTYFYYL
jgi:glutamate racemase